MEKMKSKKKYPVYNFSDLEEYYERFYTNKRNLKTSYLLTKVKGKLK